MDIQRYIKPELWNAVSKAYQAENYSHAILDAMHHISEILRDKSGGDGDGSKLVAYALAGDPPRLRVNKRQTQTEKDIQAGLIQIMSGMYMAIRNPRSHEKNEDSQETADAIIYFINYIINILDQSEEPFSISKFMDSVFDPHFVASQKYAELLISDIPKTKLFPVLLEIYKRKSEGELDKIAYITHSLIPLLSQEEFIQFIDIVSEELKLSTDNYIIRDSLQIIKEEHWSNLRELTRIRIENILKTWFKEAKAFFNETNKNDLRLNDIGALCTWVIDYFDHFDGMFTLLSNKIRSSQNDCMFILRYCPNLLIAECKSEWARNYNIKPMLEMAQKHKIFKAYLRNISFIFPDDWRGEFNRQYTEITGDDELFYEANSMDDIPF